MYKSPLVNIPDAFEYIVDPKEGFLKIVLACNVVSTNVDAVSQRMLAIIEDPNIWGADWDVLQLDLSESRMVDSVGLNWLVKLIKRVKARPAKLKVYVKNSNVYRTFLYTRMDKQMELIKLPDDPIA